MSVLVDTSVWIDYFRSGENSSDLDGLIDGNLVVINDVILAELIPFLQLKRQHEIIELLQKLDRLNMNINWSEIIEYQLKCLKSGANGIGIPVLIIAQNALQYNYQIYSLDKHFKLLQEIINVQLYIEKL